jgi:hypothetical protein
MARILLKLPAVLCLPSAAFACGCINTGTACGFFAGTEVVFAGRVIRDSGEGWGVGPARMIIEEVFHGLPINLREVEVETQAGTSCYMRLERDEEYVIYGTRDKNRPDLVHRDACSFSFAVSRNETLLNALRQAEAGGPSTLLGRVHKKKDQYGVGQPIGAGIRVVAERDGERLETITADGGEFEFSGIAPGQWRLRVDSPGLIELTKDQWPREPLTVPAGGCEVSSLTVAADGRIGGTVRDEAGKPIQGVPVQAFAMDSKGEIDTQPYLEATTDKDGRYTIAPLPAQEYVVGVNGEEYHDRLAYPPDYYPNTGRRDEATRLVLGEAEQRNDIDLVLAQPRLGATLIVEAVLEDGTPVEGGYAKALNLDGIDRAFTQASSDSILRIPLWVGESYTIEAGHFDAYASQTDDGAFRHSIDEWEGTTGVIQPTSGETRIRVILHPVSSPSSEP